MVRIIFFLLFISFHAAASECSSKENYTKTSGEKAVLCFDEKRNDLVSEKCLNDCRANKFTLESVQLSVKELKGGKDPQSVACTKLKGKLNIYKDEKQNEYAFCEADDGSAISADLINYKIK